MPPVKPFETCVYCGKKTTKKDRDATEYACGQHGIFQDGNKWAFCSSVWNQCSFECVILVQKFRQVDPSFSAILDKIRVGQPLTYDEDELLRRCETTTTTEDCIRIFPRRIEVSNENKSLFEKLEDPALLFRCTDDFHWNQQLHPELGDCWARVSPGVETSPFVACSTEEGERHRFEDVLHVKVNMPVILLSNLDIESGLANGSRGHIIGFESFHAARSPQKKRHRERSHTESWLISGEHTAHQEHAIHKFLSCAEDRVFPVVSFANGIARTIYPVCQVEELVRAAQ